MSIRFASLLRSAFASLLVVGSLSSLPAVAGTLNTSFAPSQNFDLTHWKLTLPSGDDLQPVDLNGGRSEEHTSELQSLMRISYAVFCLKKKKQTIIYTHSS